MGNTEAAVLAAYKVECDADREGAFAPYFGNIAASAGNADVAYQCCKSLKRAGLLDSSGPARGGLLNAPSYWINEKGEQALAANNA